MELEDLKNIWAEHNKKLDKNLKVNTYLLKTTTLEKTRGLMGNFKFETIFELIVNVLFYIFLMGFIADHIFEAKFLIPAIILQIMMILSIIWNIYSLNVLSKINYSIPIAVIQKKMERLRLYTIREINLLLIIIPIVTPCFVIVLLKGLIGFDAYIYYKIWFYPLITTVLITPVIVWLLRKFPDKKMEEAIRFLDEIKEFEEEGTHNEGIKK